MSGSVNFARLAFFTYRAASWNDTLSYAANVVVRPLCVMLLFALTARATLGTEAAEGFVIGSACFAVPWVIRGGILTGFEEERWQATLAMHFTSTGGRLLPFLSRGVLHAPNALAAVGSSLLGAVLFLDYSLAGIDWVLALAALLTMIASVTGACLLLGAFCVVLRNSIFVGNAAMVFFLTLSGGYIPRDDLPAAARLLAEVTPMSHGFVALWAAFAGEGIGGSAGDLAAELAVAAVFTAMGYALFRLLEHAAVRRGSYDLT